MACGICGGGGELNRWFCCLAVLNVPFAAFKHVLNHVISIPLVCGLLGPGGAAGGLTRHCRPAPHPAAPAASGAKWLSGGQSEAPRLCSGFADLLGLEV